MSENEDKENKMKVTIMCHPTASPGFVPSTSPGDSG